MDIAILVLFSFTSDSWNSLALWRERNQLHIQLNYEEDDATCQLYSLKEHGISGFCIPVTTHCWTPSSRASKPPEWMETTIQKIRIGSDPVLQSGDQMNASTAVKKAMPLCCHQRIEKLIWTNQNVRHGFQFTISADEDDEDYTPPTAIRWCKLIAWIKETRYETPFTI